MDKPIKYLAVVKEDQQYLFRYRSGDEPVVLKSILFYAKSRHFNLDYSDLVAMVKQLRDSMVEELNL